MVVVAAVVVIAAVVESMADVWLRAGPLFPLWPMLMLMLMLVLMVLMLVELVLLLVLVQILMRKISLSSLFSFPLSHSSLKLFLFKPSILTSILSSLLSDCEKLVHVQYKVDWPVILQVSFVPFLCVVLFWHFFAFEAPFLGEDKL